MLPVFALVSPPIVLVLALVSRAPLSLRLLEAYWLLGLLAPALGLATLAIQVIQWVTTRVEFEPGTMSRRRVTVFAGLAVVSPVWLIVMFFVVAGFNR